MSEIDSSLLLTSEDREDGVDGFSIVADGHGNTTLLKRGKRVGWFSAAVNEETLTAFLELVEACERSAKGGNVSVVKTE